MELYYQMLVIVFLEPYDLGSWVLYRLKILSELPREHATDLCQWLLQHK